MNDASKIKPSHIQRAAFVYIRQSSPAQVEYNRESTARQYALVEKACHMGWAKEQVNDGLVSRATWAIRQELPFWKAAISEMSAMDGSS